MVRRCVASWLLKASDVMTSHDTVRRADRARQSSPALPAGAGAVTQVARPRLGPLHEGRVLLGRVRGYFMRCGGSCSTHSPWPVHPRPRAVRRPEEGSGQGQVEPAPPGPEQVSHSGWSGSIQIRHKAPESITCTARCPRSGHQRPHRRHIRQESLEFCDSFSSYGVWAVLMSAAWTSTTRQTALIGPSPHPRPPGPLEAPPKRVPQRP